MHAQHKGQQLRDRMQGSPWLWMRGDGSRQARLTAALGLSRPSQLQCHSSCQPAQHVRTTQTPALRGLAQGSRGRATPNLEQCQGTGEEPVTTVHKQGWAA